MDALARGAVGPAETGNASGRERAFRGSTVREHVNQLDFDGFDALGAKTRVAPVELGEIRFYLEEPGIAERVELNCAGKSLATKITSMTRLLLRVLVAIAWYW